MGLLKAALITAFLLAIFPVSLNSFSHRRNTVGSSDPLNGLLSESSSEPENTQVGDENLQNSLDHSRNLREIDGSSSALKNTKTHPNNFSPVKRKGNRHRPDPKQVSLPISSDDAQHTKEGFLDQPNTVDNTEATDRAFSEPSAFTSTLSSNTSSPSPSAFSTHPHKPSDAKGRGPGDGLFASEGALYRALYVIFALILLLILYLFIKFAMYAQSDVFLVLRVILISENLDNTFFEFCIPYCTNVHIGFDLYYTRIPQLC